MGLRLGFHFHAPAILKEDQIWLPGFLGRFIDSLAEYCEYVAYFAYSPRSDEYRIIDYKIRSPNVILIDIGPHDSVLKRTLFAGRYTSSLLHWRSRLDVLLIRGPSPLLPAFANVAKPLPTVFLLVGDYLTGVNELPQPWWRKELIRAWAYWNSWSQSSVIRKGLTFVNSHKLFMQLQAGVPNLVETRTTTLEKGDFYERLDTCQSQPIHLLYAGRLSESKGLFLVLDAVSSLVSKNIDIIFDLVGWPEKGEENIINRFESFAKKKGLSERVIFHGYKAVGPDLFTFYQKADIFVLASTSSEGFPRTIWEAMAHSLPVIATRVGSIPNYIEGAAELVEPNDAVSIESAILRLIQLPELRQNYIRRAIELVRNNTLDVRAEEMIRTIEKWLEDTD